MELLKSFSSRFIEAGCDEVGRGCLWGPVVAAAVIVDENFNQNLVNDSKKLTFKTRQALDEYIKENVKDFAISELSPAFIDENNILNASIHAMHLSLDQLKVLFLLMETVFIRMELFLMNVSSKVILKYFLLPVRPFWLKIIGIS